MINRSYIGAILCAASLTLGLVNESRAATINASKNDGPTTETQHTLNGDGTVEIGSSNEPISVELDPTQGAWIKQITVDTSQPPIFPDISFDLDEYLIIEGSSWSDWHEEILTDDWVWEDTPIAISVQRPSDSQPIVPPGLSFNITDESTKLDFFFDPLPEGTILNITKRMTYIGLGDFDGIVEIRQYPTKTPENFGTIGLIALGLIGTFQMTRQKLNNIHK